MKKLLILLVFILLICGCGSKKNYNFVIVDGEEFHNVTNFKSCGSQIEFDVGDTHIKIINVRNVIVGDYDD